jgi:uncharacterized protein YqgV (UPF0045/DUF77 family)
MINAIKRVMKHSDLTLERTPHSTSTDGMRQLAGVIRSATEAVEK